MTQQRDDKASARILICEPDIQVAREIAQTVRHLGYRVAGKVASRDEAVQATRETEPDLILMDIKLEGEIGGIEAAEKIRERMEVPVIYLVAEGEQILKRAQETEPYGYVGKPVRVLEMRTIIEMALLKDKAERKLRESEEKFKTIVEGAPEALFVQTRGIFAYLNHQALRLFGAESQEDLLGKPVMDRFHPRFHEAIKERIRVLNIDRNPVQNLEEIALRLDGSEMAIEVSAVPIRFRGQDGALVLRS